MSVAVVNKIETILHSSYHTKNYVDFIREIFPGVKMVAPDKFNKEYSNFSSHIEGYIHVGTFQTPDKKKILIMAVQQRKAGYVENARSTQRSFAKKLIENGNADAALIAFYTDGDPKWRLSLVRLDYEMKIENGRLKAAENLTPAKRYSYLVGQDEPCHTAISRFNQFITDSVSRPAHPTLDDLEEAFSVEKVTDEFFQLYCEKFHQLREQLESIEVFRIEAEQHNFTSAQFAKKLMGQIVFLYFLQKKGWLGVKAWPDKLTEKEYKNAYYARGAKSRELIPIVYRPVGDGTYRVSAAALQNISDADEEVLAQCVRGNPWGSGPRDFMRKLFNIAVQRNQNFYSELLEPLFYDALNRNRGEQGYCPALHCRIPFLSGGLFEPIDGYDWEHNDFAIPNEVFSNESIKGKREADGILDIFDRYNFTMSEDEPMEREVAIDPEMLGKVFENLLEVKDRKSKGAFYTPREIVHYMCQESLINYLANKLGISEEAIRSFILYGDYIKDQDTEKTIRVADKNGKYHMEFDFEKDLYISEEILSFKKGVNRLMDMDKALQDVRVADPAVGSGAFPLGMLNEIVRARQNISAYLTITMRSNDVRMMYLMDRAPHTLKYETIRNCIFAADIDPSAVDIAQLRLWLALVIDDEINPDAHNELEGHRNPRPLPNLECNILCGNSLIDEFEGIRLFKESNLLGSSQYQLDMDSARFDTIVQKLITAQDELFRCADPMKKTQLKEEIESLRDMIILAQLEGCKPEVLEKYYESKRLAAKPYVLWQLDFARVFREKGGFDIVIGNPPYVGEKGHKDMFQEIAATDFGKRFYYGKVDLFYFFFHKGLDILHDKGIDTLITTNYYVTALGARKLRADFKERAGVIKAINFNELKLFPSALGQHNMITILQKGVFDKPVKTAITSHSGQATVSVLDNILGWKDGSTEYYSFVQEQLYEGQENYMRLTGVGNEDNPLESIFVKMQKAKNTLGAICAVNIGMRTGADKLSESYINKYGIDLPKNTGIYVLTDAEAKQMPLTEYERSLLVPWFKNSDIAQYRCKPKNTLWLIDFSVPAHEDMDFDKIPNLYAHILRFKAVLENRRSNDNGLQAVIKRGLWWAFTMRQIDFSAPKIVSPQRSKKNTFGYNEIPWYASMDVYFITALPDSIVDLKYILALLNSKLYFVWLYNKGKRKGDTLELYQKPLSEVPVIIPSSEQSRKIVSLVDDILNSNDDSRIKNNKDAIDEIIYDLFELTRQERELVESIIADNDNV